MRRRQSSAGGGSQDDLKHRFDHLDRRISTQARSARPPDLTCSLAFWTIPRYRATLESETDRWGERPP